MAGTPLKHAVLAELRSRATQLSDEATPLDYACGYIANGGQIVELAQSIAVAIGTPVSRSFLSGVLHNLSDDASERLGAARRESASALVEEAAKIADDAEPFPASVAKAGLQIRTRHWMAERFSPNEFGQKPPSVNIVNAGTLMLDALRVPVAALAPIPEDEIAA